MNKILFMAMIMAHSMSLASIPQMSANLANKLVEAVGTEAAIAEFAKVRTVGALKSLLRATEASTFTSKEVQSALFAELAEITGCNLSSRKTLENYIQSVDNSDFKDSDNIIRAGSLKMLPANYEKCPN